MKKSSQTSEATTIESNYKKPNDQKSIRHAIRWTSFDSFGIRPVFNQLCCGNYSNYEKDFHFGRNLDVYFPGVVERGYDREQLQHFVDRLCDIMESHAYNCCPWILCTLPCLFMVEATRGNQLKKEFRKVYSAECKRLDSIGSPFSWMYFIGCNSNIWLILIWDENNIINGQKSMIMERSPQNIQYDDFGNIIN